MTKTPTVRHVRDLLSRKMLVGQGASVDGVLGFVWIYESDGRYFETDMHFTRYREVWPEEGLTPTDWFPLPP